MSVIRDTTDSRLLPAENPPGHLHYQHQRDYQITNLNAEAAQSALNETVTAAD
jgi:hypothetical protein